MTTHTGCDHIWRRVKDWRMTYYVCRKCKIAVYSEPPTKREIERSQARLAAILGEEEEQ